MALSTPIDLTSRGYGANSGVVTTKYPHSQFTNPSPVKVVSNRFNAVDALAVKGAALATNDVFPLVDVPAGAFVLGVAAKVVTAEGGTCTVHIGTGDDVDGYFASLDANAAADTLSFSWDESPASLATTAGVGHFFSAADTIDLKLISGTYLALVVDISVIYIEAMPLAS